MRILRGGDHHVADDQGSAWRARSEVWRNGYGPFVGPFLGPIGTITAFGIRFALTVDGLSDDSRVDEDGGDGV